MKRLLSLFLLVTTILFAQDFPSPVGHINDFAHILTTSDATELENILTAYEDTTSIQIAIVTIESLNGETVEQYTNDLANEWGVGQKETDNGLVILVSMNDKKWRIETGYGLEPYLPDIICNQLGEKITDNFKKGDYPQGLKEVTYATIDWLGSFDNAEKEEILQKVEEASTANWLMIVLIILAVLFVLFILAWLESGTGGGYSSGGFGGGSSGGSSFGGFGGGSFGGGGSSGGW